MKHYLYLSNTCSEQEYSKINEGVKKLPSQQAGKFNRLFAEGFAQNNCDITMISSRPVNPALHPKKLYKKEQEVENNVKYIYPAFFNIRYLRQIMILINSMKAIKKWCKQNPDGVIFCDILNYSLLLAVSKVVKKTKNKLIGIVTDLPEILAEGYISKRTAKQNALIANCDGLVLLAEPMTDRINPFNKPYTIMEGFCDINMADKKNLLENKYEKKVVLYAGMLHKKYGIKNLTEAFIKADISESEFHIYGTGDYEEELKELIKDNDKIKFFGCVDNTVVVEEQLKSTLLVNPRPTDEEFVKYSFPSKNMEYIVSGTPMLTTNLPSMPEEYKEHCFVAENFDVDGLCKELTKILSMDKEELYKFGEESKIWALENKNNVIQAKRVMDFVEKV